MIKNSPMHASCLQESRRLLYPVGVLMIGLLIAQVIGALLVYHSNRGLLDKLTRISQAGTGPLPGLAVEPPLASLTAALAGGLFFTLSTGAGVVLLTMGAFGLFTALPLKWKKYAVFFLALSWAALLIWANMKGVSPGLSFFLLLVPPPVWWACRKWRPPLAAEARLPWRRAFHLLLIAVLFVLWVSRINSDVFINIKDNLLLTSAPGKKIVHLYYRYTLYPAEVFKSLSQKQIRSCRLEEPDSDDMKKRVAAALAAKDYFPVTDGKTDLTVTMVADHLLFTCRGGRTVSETASNFLESPGEVLNRVSRECDGNGAFRHFTIFSLLFTAPLALYLFFLTAFSLVPGLLVGRRISSWLAPGFCFLLGTAAIIYLDMPPPTTADRRSAAIAIESGSRRERIAALRYIYENKLDIGQFNGYEELLDSDDFGQLYWLVRNLGNSRNPGARRHIFRFLNADSPYLVCKAIEASVPRKVASRAIMDGRLEEALLRNLSLSDNWYVQMYAYQAARRLGWTPEKSG